MEKFIEELDELEQINRKRHLVEQDLVDILVCHNADRLPEAAFYPFRIRCRDAVGVFANSDNKEYRFVLCEIESTYIDYNQEHAINMAVVLVTIRRDGVVSIQEKTR